MSGKALVIGAGIVGLCSADELQRRGYAVTVLDRDHAALNCSYGNGGIVVPSHFVPFASPGLLRAGLRMMLNPGSPFGLESLPNWEMLAWMARFLKSATRSHVARSAPILASLNLRSKQLLAEMVGRIGGEVGYEERGLLMLCRSDHALAEEMDLGREASGLGLKTRDLNRAELAALEPAVDWGSGISGGVHFLDDAHLSPTQLMKALRADLTRRGVRMAEGEVSSLRTEQGRVVSAESFEADLFVLAAGAWSGQIARTGGLQLPLLSGRGYGITAAGEQGSPTIPSILVEARIAVTPMVDGARFVGTMELGLPPRAGIAHQFTEKRIDGMLGSIGGYYAAYPVSRFERSAVWMGHRPCPPDGMPYIGKSSRFSNLVVAAGHAMMGLSLGAVTGKIVGELADGEPPSCDLELLNPDRFAGR